MTISEKVAYLKGLSAGLGIETETTKESKMLVEIIKVLEEIGYSMEDLETGVDNLGDEIDAVSDDLQDVESIVYDVDDEDEDEDEDEEEDDEPDFFETECPACGAALTVDEEALNDGFVICPNCHERFALDLADDGNADEPEDDGKDE